MSHGGDCRTNVRKLRIWQNSECAKTQKLKFWQNSTTQNKTKKNSKCDKPQKLKMWQNSKTQMRKNLKTQKVTLIEKKF